MREGVDALTRPNRRRAPGDPSALRGIPALVKGGYRGAMRGTDPRDDDPADVAVYCPRCWSREFGGGVAAAGEF